jgi:hypothetical protein
MGEKKSAKIFGWETRMSLEDDPAQEKSNGSLLVSQITAKCSHSTPYIM